MVLVHEKKTSLCQIVHVQKFALGGSCAPAYHLFGTFQLGFVEPTHHGRQHMAVFRMVVVSRPIQVGGHGTDEVATVLVAVGVAHLEPCDFGNGIGLIGGLELPSQQGIFPHGLGGMLGVNAGTPQKKKLLHTRPTAALDDIRLHDEVVVEKVAPQSVVGMDATDFRGGEVDVPGLGLGQKRHHRLLVPQIQFL